MTTKPVASPCNNICRMHESTGWCEGCMRTLDEITSWSSLSEEGKRALTLELRGRRRLWRERLLPAAGSPR